MTVIQKLKDDQKESWQHRNWEIKKLFLNQREDNKHGKFFTKQWNEAHHT